VEGLEGLVHEPKIRTLVPHALRSRVIKMMDKRDLFIMNLFDWWFLIFFSHSFDKLKTKAYKKKHRPISSTFLLPNWKAKKISILLSL
jgi:hypothetical protein